MRLCFVPGKLTVLLLLAALTHARAPGAVVTTARLLDEMTNISSMAEFPSPSYLTRQFSSYDRASRSPGNEAWFANDDRGQYLRTEQRDGRTEYVMMDYAGAGAVVRIWSANPRGNLRIYLDGAEAPAIEANMEQLLGGKHPAFPVPIAGVRARGYNLYFPIPFAKHCKITSDEGEFYYIVNYRAYDPGTDVETFKPEQLQQLRDAIQKTAKVLASPVDARIEPRERNEFEAKLEPGASAELGKMSGAGAITQFLVRVNLPRNDEGALRGLVLEMEFDGETTVEAPLGDFFGSAVSLRSYASLPMGVEDRQAQESSNPHGELWSHWVMPFEKSAVVRVRNEGKSAVGLTGTIGTAPHEWNEHSMHFHAGYRARFDFPTRPHVDWNYLSARGKGVFAGVSLSIDNPVRAWWGEGDEKIYVDGESFPGWFGTGSEDYFGYAWCDPTPFAHAYHNQPRCDGPGNYGRTFVNRFHIMDRIPFTEQFRFDMELWHWADVKVNQAVTTYWYARPGATDDYEPLKPADLAVRPMPAYEPPTVAGAIEGEQMMVLSRTAAVAPQSWDGTSGDHHMWWHGGVKEGDQLALGFAAPKPGRYRVLGRFLKAGDYGTHQLAINGTDAGKPIDFFNQGVIVAPEVELGVFELKKQNELSVRAVGANTQADKQHMFGLDYLRLEPVDEQRSPAKSSAVEQPAGAKAVAADSGDPGPSARPDARQFRLVYDPGAGESEPWYINDHCFVRDDDGTWHLFGITHAEPAMPLDEKKLAHATAKSLAGPWVKQPFALEADEEKWRESVLWAPHIVRHDGTYYMFYCAGDRDHAAYKIHLATSKDLRTWIRHPANPMLVDGFDARDPMVIRIGDRWVMYYTATSEPAGGNHVVAAVTSTDLVRWENKRVVFTAPMRGTFGGPTESPFVVAAGDAYYLFCGSWSGYAQTRVFRSRDPFQWSMNDQVGVIDSHALEVVRESDGSWYASHCGWGQGGVFLAPLEWKNDALRQSALGALRR